MAARTSSKQRARAAHAVYAIFFFVGVASSLPWNVFITAQKYFQQRLADTDYEESFLNWFSMGFNISTLLSMLIRTACVGERMPSAVSTVFFSLVVTICVIFGHCLLTRMPEYSGDEFFKVTMISILIIASATTVQQDGMLRIVSKFPQRFTEALVAGQAMAGLAVSVSNFFITMARPDDAGFAWLRVMGKNADLCAFVYFVMVFVSLVGCVLAFAVLTRMAMFRHYNDVDHPVGDYLDEKLHDAFDTDDSARETLLSEEEKAERDAAEPSPGAAPGDRVDLFELAFTIRYYAAAIFLVFVVTLAVFPGITSAISSTNPERGRFFRDLFTPFTLILFNSGDFVGRLLASRWHRTSARRVLGASLVRLAFFPLLMLCNLRNEHGAVITRVVFNSDVLSLHFLLACAVTNGLVSTLALMHYPRLLRTNKEKELGGTIMFFVLSIGLTAGSLMSFVLRAMLKQ